MRHPVTECSVYQTTGYGLRSTGDESFDLSLKQLEGTPIEPESSDAIKDMALRIPVPRVENPRIRLPGTAYQTLVLIYGLLRILMFHWAGDSFSCRYVPPCRCFRPHS